MSFAKFVNKRKWHQYTLPTHVFERPPSCVAPDDDSDDSTPPLPVEVEMNNRIWACELIQQSCLILDLPQRVAATAQVLFHRYFYIHSMRDKDVLIVAMTCTLTAARVEETPRFIRDVCNSFDRVLKVRQLGEGESSDKLKPLLLESDMALGWRDSIASLEAPLLEELGFTLYCEHPHKHVLSFVNVVAPGHAEFAQRAWNFANDSMRVPLCLKFSPAAIAAACVALTARIVRIHLPANLWTLLEVSQSQLDEIMSVLSELYTRPKVQYIPLPTDTAVHPARPTASVQPPQPPDTNHQ